MYAVIEMRMAGYPVERQKAAFVEHFADMLDEPGSLTGMALDDQVTSKP